jgi:hypothetical protein
VPRKKISSDDEQRHWLTKAKPKYAIANGLWRVRIMRNGQKHNWWLKAGKGDSSSSGMVLATAEWGQMQRQIIADESGIKHQLGVQQDGTFKVLSDDIFDDEGAANDGTFIRAYDSKQEYSRVLRRQIYRAEYESSPFVDRMSLDEYLDWLDFKESRSSHHLESCRAQTAPSGVPAGPNPFTNLLNAFEASLQLAQAGTTSGLDDDEGMGKSRLEQYQFSIAHMKKAVGEIVCEPLGSYWISELQLEDVLKTYRDHCKREVAEYHRKGVRGRSEHWFNEKMKAARKLASFLADNRLCNGLPAGIKRVTKKSKVKAKAHPIPPPVLRAIWQVADDKFKTYMLLALNVGFRQTEIGLLSWDERHVCVEAGKVIIDKDRGKTGVPIKIPLWDVTQEFIKRHASAKGSFFEFEGRAEKAAIECIGKRWKKLTSRAAKTEPEAKQYHFENLRDTGASFLRTLNPFLVPLYLGQATKGDAAMYITEVKDEEGKTIIPMFLDKALEKFLAYLKLPWPA